MTRFTDGPAADTVLMLHRAPHYLRAVRSTDGTWDALDQLTDTPAADETIVAYAMVGEPSRCHVQRSVKGKRVCGWYEGGEYRVVAEQPSDDVLRSTASWRAWVSERVGRPIAVDGSVETVNP